MIKHITALLAVRMEEHRQFVYRERDHISIRVPGWIGARLIKGCGCIHLAQFALPVDQCAGSRPCSQMHHHVVRIILQEIVTVHAIAVCDPIDQDGRFLAGSFWIEVKEVLLQPLSQQPVANRKTRL